MSVQIEVGQKWRFKKASRTGYFTRGKLYEILAFDPDEGKVNITDNKGNRSNGGAGHIWHATKSGFYDHFEPAFPVVLDIKAALADEAKSIVSGARRAAYGKPEDNFERIARFWQAYFENTGRGAVNLTAADVSPLMRLMKEARLCETPDHRDSFVDLIGYTLTGAEINKVDPQKSA